MTTTPPGRPGGCIDSCTDSCIHRLVQETRKKQKLRDFEHFRYVSRRASPPSKCSSRSPPPSSSTKEGTGGCLAHVEWWMSTQDAIKRGRQKRCNMQYFTGTTGGVFRPLPKGSSHKTTHSGKNMKSAAFSVDHRQLHLVDLNASNHKILRQGHIYHVLGGRPCMLATRLAGSELLAWPSSPVCSRILPVCLPAPYTCTHFVVALTPPTNATLLLLE